MDESLAIDGREAKSFEEFFADRFAPLARLAFLLTGSAAVADEIAQDACEQVLRRWSDVSFPGAYARVAVVNGSRAWGRRQARSSAYVPEPPGPVMLDSDAVAVRAALATLPSTEREVLVLRFYVDLTVDDIARDLKLPSGTVKSHIHRGLLRMQGELS